MIGEEITRFVALVAAGMYSDPQVTNVKAENVFKQAVETMTLTYGPPCEEPMQSMTKAEAAAAGVEQYSYEAVRPMSPAAPGRAACDRCEWPKHLHGR